MRPVLLVHDSARMRADDAMKRVLREATNAGYARLSKGESSVNAVESAIKICEDSGLFNAGVGSHLNLVGEAEMDASIMDGKTLGSGGVAIIRGVRNPISVARRVLDAADKTLVILAGDGAYKFAIANGLERITATNPERQNYWKKLRDALAVGEELPGVNLPDPKLLRQFLKRDEEGTVGAIALDLQGNFASGVSSGGTPLKLPGRVGDIPIVGCSNYADNQAGAVSITGTGNIVVRYSLAKSVADLMRSGFSAKEATSQTVHALKGKVEKFVIGIAAIDREGGVGVAKNLDGMPTMCMDGGVESPYVPAESII